MQSWRVLKGCDRPDAVNFVRRALVFFRRFLQEWVALVHSASVPPRILFFFGLCAIILVPVLEGTAQQGASVSEDEKRRLFLKARENIQTTSALQAQASSQGASAKSNPKTDQKSSQTAPSKPSPKPIPKPVPKPVPKASPSSAPKAAPVKEATAFPQPAAKSQAKPVLESVKPVVPPSPAPLAAPRVPSAAPRTGGSKNDTDLDAPVVIEKSGVDREQGLQTPSFFGWFSRWKYLSSGVRKEIDRAPVQKGRWRYIVVHNSGTRQGNAKSFEYYHRQVRKMQNGLAYQFVIGNGTSSGDGQVEVGSRWPKQINGGHVHSDYLNNIAIGICLVGDFNHEQPTAKQLEALDELIRYLRQRVGKTEGKWAVVKAHKEINPPRWPTDCPGNDFPYRWLHNKFD